MTPEEEKTIILDFLDKNPEQFSSRKKKDRPNPRTQSGREEIGKIIDSAREKRHLPREPKTVPDEVVSIILELYFDVSPEKLECIKIEHQLSMAAENIVGELLERYISEACREHGSDWVQAYGDVVKAVDFIRKDGDGWELLQVKNRDNSENSSSQAIRDGTSIKK